MPAANFAQQARRSPSQFNNAHGYVCHTAVLYWAFKDLGDSDSRAKKKMEAIAQSQCPQCTANPPVVCHRPSILGTWFAPLSAISTPILGVAGLAVFNVGDVVILGNPNNPMHTMVVVRVNGGDVFIRGFNNVGTFGPPSPHLAYDNHDRNLNTPGLWVGNSFGIGNQPMYRVTYANYIAAAANVRNSFQHCRSRWVYR